MKRLGIFAAAPLVLLGGSFAAFAADPPSCRGVRFADIGWTDVAVTTALTSRILEGLGYQPTIRVLSVPVTYVALRNKDLDVFLGNWMPTMAADRAPYEASHSIDVIGPNLVGARYTLAASEDTYRAGLHGFADIARFRAALGGKIYGIEPGNDGNRVVLGMIKSDKFGLGSFDLVESSEQGMLSQLDRAIRRHEMIVFLGWEPHPMNMKYRMRYLADPTDTFGPANGGAAVFTNVRTGYTADCPNVGRLLSQLKFSLPAEDRLMNAVLFRGVPPATAAEAWLHANKQDWAPWLGGVTTLEGAPAVPALQASIDADSTSWLARTKLPLGAWLASLVDAATSHGRGFFDLTSLVLGGMISGLTAGLLLLPAPVTIAAMAGGAYALHRSVRLSAFIVIGLALVVNLGYWVPLVQTLAQVFSATFFCIVVGVPVGIAAARRPWLFQAMRPVLDLMQTIPTFVYLIPTLVIFGLGAVPGLISTVIFAIAAPIRLTHLGITSVPLALREAGEAFGATRLQLLLKVELPYALPTIMAGITQCIMLSLSMVVIAALVGADGLGKPVVRALNSVNVAMGFEAGLAIVILAIILDRVCKRPEPR